MCLEYCLRFFAEQVVEEIHSHWIRRGSYKGQFIANRRMALDREQRRQYHCVQCVQIAYVGNAQRRLALSHASGYGAGIRSKGHAPIQSAPQPEVFQRLAGVDASRNMGGITQNQRRITESGKQ